MSDQDLSEFYEIATSEELRAEIRRLQGRLEKAKAKTADLREAVLEGSREAAITMGLPPKVPKCRRDARKSKGEVGMLLLSDWHFGKSTPSFNSEVAGERVLKVAEKTVDILAVERGDHPVREVHVLLDGDFVENMGIFPGQAHETDSGLFMQMKAAKLAGIELLRLLLANVETVHVWEEYGNHGRLGRKGDHPGEDSADLLVYQLMREALAEEEIAGRLVWHESQGWYSIVEAGNYRAMLIHGDEIRSFGGGTPAFGIVRKANAWASGVVEPFIDIMMGHFHQPLVLPLANGRGRVFVNPSLESDSPYAKEFVAATGTPGQRLNFVEPEEGMVTSERVLWVG